MEIHRFAFSLRDENQGEITYLVGLRAQSFLELAMWQQSHDGDFWDCTLTPNSDAECELKTQFGTDCENHKHALGFFLDPEHHNMFRQAHPPNGKPSNGNLLRAVVGMVIGQLGYLRSEGPGATISIDQVTKMQEVVLRGNFLGNQAMGLIPHIGEFFDLEAAIATEVLRDAG